MNGSREGGFSLIEVLVAFVILALALATLSSAFGNGLRGMRAAEQRLRAVTVAENLLAAAGRNAPLEPGVRSGATEGLQWLIDITPWLDPGSDATPAAPGAVLLTFQVSARVAWGSAPADAVALTTLRAVPRAQAER
ncbi:MAG: type IV pilus modification PilV family protein [Chromatiales bacterium]